MLYELNINKEADNGMLINTKIDTNTNSLIENDLNDNNNNQVKTESVFFFQEEGNIEGDKKFIVENINKEIKEQKNKKKFWKKLKKWDMIKNM